MLNHLRTLLVNTSGELPFAGRPGEELVDRDFRPVRLSGGARVVWETLFGRQPDAWMRNYRARQLLACCHLPELEEVTLSLDGRISYDLADSPFYDGALFQPQITFASADSPPAYVLGDAGPHDSQGRLERRWQITAGSGSWEARLLSPLAVSSAALTVTGGLSSELPLIGSGLRFRVGGAPSPGQVWEVASRVRPNQELPALAVELSRLGAALLDVFRVGSPAAEQAPLKGLRAMWEEHFSVPYRLGALTLALALRMESLRQ